MPAGAEFRVKELVVCGNFEPPAIGRDEGDRLDLRLEIIE
jgi:hypothetical protein